MRNNGYTKADQLMQIVEDRGYRSTAPRQALVRSLAAKERHFTAEELHKELPNVGRATVYRFLNLMVDAGAICRVLLEDGSLHYQMSHRGHHHHLICTKCGISQELHGCDIEGILMEKASQHQFQPEGHWLEIYGRCRKCLSE